MEYDVLTFLYVFFCFPVTIELGKKKLKVADLPVREDDEGNWVVKAKLKNVLAGTYKNGDPRAAKSIALYDSQGKPLKDTLVRGGSKVKLAYGY